MLQNGGCVWENPEKACEWDSLSTACYLLGVRGLK